MVTRRWDTNTSLRERVAHSVFPMIGFAFNNKKDKPLVTFELVAVDARVSGRVGFKRLPYIAALTCSAKNASAVFLCADVKSALGELM